MGHVHLILKIALFGPWDCKEIWPKNPSLPCSSVLNKKDRFRKTVILFVNSLPLVILPLNKIFKGKTCHRDNKSTGPVQQQVLNEWKHDRVTYGSQFSREGFSAWLGKKVKAKMEGHVLPSLKLSRNIFLHDFQQSSKRLVSKVLFFGLFVFFHWEITTFCGKWTLETTRYVDGCFP